MKFINPKKIRFHHCDPAGIVFYPQYYYLLHETQEDFFSHINFSLYSIIEQGHGVPIVDMKTQFKGMCRQGEDVVIELSFSKIGGSSMTMEYEIFGTVQNKKNENDLKLKATGTIVFVELKTSRPQKIPDALRQALMPYLETTHHA